MLQLNLCKSSRLPKGMDKRIVGGTDAHVTVRLGQLPFLEPYLQAADLKLAMLTTQSLIATLHCSTSSTSRHRFALAIHLHCCFRHPARSYWHLQGTQHCDSIQHPGNMHQHALHFILSCHLKQAMCNAGLHICLLHCKHTTAAISPQPNRLQSAEIR